MPFIAAMNIDLKSMQKKFYRDVCGGSLDDVQRTIRIAAEACHVELTNLVIPGHNDSDEDFERLSEWVSCVNPSIPLHFSRYFPRYRFDTPETPRDTLTRAREIARKKLRYVYLGNIPDAGASDTICHSCGNVLVARTFYNVLITGVRNGKCTRCDDTVDIRGLES